MVKLKSVEEYKDKYSDEILLLYEALTAGFLKKDDVIRHVGLGCYIVTKLANVLSLELPDFRGKSNEGIIGKNRQVIDELIKEGESQSDIAGLLGVSRELVRQYINRKGYYNIWKESKESRSRVRRNIESRLVNAILEYTLYRADEENNGEAVRYYLSPYVKISLEKLVNLVKVYKIAREDDYHISFQKLAELSDFKDGNQARSILSRMGFNSLNWTCNKALSSEKKEAIRRVFDSELSCGDIAYLLNVKKAVIIHHQLSKLRPRNRKNKHPNMRKGGYGIKRFSKEIMGYKVGFGNYLTYRDASQIYGFKDVFNSSNNEIAGAIGKPLNVVEYALKHRKKIEQKLVDALNKMFPGEMITNGYR